MPIISRAHRVQTRHLSNHSSNHSAILSRAWCRHHRARAHHVQIHQMYVFVARLLVSVAMTRA